MTSVNEMSDKDVREYKRLLEQKKKSDERSLRLRVKNQILVIKARELGLEVTNEEIDDYISNMK